MERVLRVSATVLCLLGGIATVAMMALMTVDVLGRQRWTPWSPLAGAFEVSEALMALVAFLPLMYVQHNREHIFVTVATRRLPQRVQAAIDALNGIVALVLFGAWSYWAVERALQATRMGDTRSGIVEIPNWPFRWLMAGGLILLTIELLRTVMRELLVAAGRVEEEEVDLAEIERAM